MELDKMSVEELLDKLIGETAKYTTGNPMAEPDTIKKELLSRYKKLEMADSVKHAVILRLYKDIALLEKTRELMATQISITPMKLDINTSTIQMCPSDVLRYFKQQASEG